MRDINEYRSVLRSAHPGLGTHPGPGSVGAIMNNVRLLLLLAALPLWGAADANRILKRLVDAQDKNWEQARQYAYTEELTNFAYDKNGQPVQNGAAFGKSSS